MSNHTPGPWSFDPSTWDFDFTEDWGLESEDGATWKTLAARGEDCPIALITGRYDGGALAEARFEANAKLIIAAPDMLAALQAWADHYDMPGNKPEPGSLHADMLAAIAKATGRADEN